jgi:thioredoxin-related protein
VKRLPLLIAALLVVALASTAGAEGHVAWRGWDEGLREARRTNRPVLVDVYTDWCGWCKRMDRDVYSRADVRDYLASRFVVVRLNAEAQDGVQYEGQDLTSAGLAEQFRVTGYPTTVFLKSSGAHLINVPGYVPADRFMLVLRYIGEGHMEKGVEWESFLKANGGKP